MDSRQKIAAQWLDKVLPHQPVKMKLLSGDASFRRYFRVIVPETSYVLMDAPPEKEDCRLFIRIGEQLKTGAIRIPEIYADDSERGFLLLEDFGDTLFLSGVDTDDADTLYQQAIHTLINIQQIDCRQLPTFDEAMLMDEMQLFVDWYCRRHLGFIFSSSQLRTLYGTFEKLAANALLQPQVFVHRDYHSRNLMLLSEGEIGVLDYQDAVCGPISYDLVSLLKDCYIRWQPEKMTEWMNYFLEYCRHQQDSAFNANQFKRWFDWMGVQRHLKASGIFARLYYRDNKAGYLKDIPRTLSYITDCAREYPELSDFCDLLERLPVPQ